MPLLIKTPRLSLQPFNPAQINSLVKLANDKAVASMVASIPYPFSEDDAKKWLLQRGSCGTDRNGHLFAVNTSNAELAGVIGIDRQPGGLFDLGYWLGRCFWGKGYASEATVGLLSWAESELGIKAITADFFEDNLASARVLEKTGFLRTGINTMRYSRGRSEEALSIGMIWMGSSGTTVKEAAK